MSRTTRMSAAALLTVTGLGAGLSAVAAVVPDAVTDVRIAETSAYTWSQLKLTVDWKVPDGTKAGDTFTLEMPAVLTATDGKRFPLNDADGRTVANAVVTGRTVTFTMTDYAETHVGVHGSAWFWVDLADTVKPGDDLDLSFTVGSTVYRDSLAVRRPGPGNPDYPYKWQAWMKATPNAGGDRILWAITGPATSTHMVGSSYEITDRPGEGQRIDCAKIDVFSGKASGANSFTDVTYVAPNRWKLACNPSTATVTITPRADEIGRAFRLLGQSVVTDPDRTEYTNRGSVRLWGTTDLPVSSVIRAGGGGEGTGTTPSPTTPNPTTTSPSTPTPTPSTVTVTETVTPTATVTVTETVTATATVTATPTPTVTVPGQPAPTVTVTTTPTPTVTVPGQPAPTVTTTPQPTVTVPGQPAPTVTTTPNPTVTVTGVPAPRPTSPGTTPGATTTTRGQTPTVTVTAAAHPQPVVVTRHTTPAAQPQRIDTGVPPQGADLRLAGVGGLLALGGGVGLIAMSRRTPRREES